MAVVTRRATHAGSWYSGNPIVLSQQLDAWLDAVPNPVPSGPTTARSVGLPVINGRVIIAPHAGYSYSGPFAAFAYAALDLSKVKNIFLLGPSHKFYLPDAALSRCTHYATPMGDLKLDKPIIASLRASGEFRDMSLKQDESEHSMELHLPFIYKILSNQFDNPTDFPTLIPIMIGSTSKDKESLYGSVLAPYLADPNSIFIVSSDFCHWGLRFDYTYHLPDENTPLDSGIILQGSAKAPVKHKIHQSIQKLDGGAMEAIENGDHVAYLDQLQQTNNTVCGRHPIGVIMSAMQQLRGKARLGSEEKFQFLCYGRSSECVDVSDSSVSYASAVAAIGDARSGSGDP